jgi:hypothetical protein
MDRQKVLRMALQSAPQITGAAAATEAPQDRRQRWQPLRATQEAAPLIPHHPAACQEGGGDVAG